MPCTWPSLGSCPRLWHGVGAATLALVGPLMKFLINSMKFLGRRVTEGGRIASEFNRIEDVLHVLIDASVVYSLRWPAITVLPAWALWAEHTPPFILFGITRSSSVGQELLEGLHVEDIAVSKGKEKHLDADGEVFHPSLHFVRGPETLFGARDHTILDKESKSNGLPEGEKHEALDCDKFPKGTVRLMLERMRGTVARGGWARPRILRRP
jgi:hypothetical protein